MMRKLIILIMVASLFLFNYVAAQPLVDEAMTHLGQPYSYAATGPNIFDCSGFTYYCCKTVYNIELKRTAREQGYDETYKLITDVNDLMPGDLVYFNTNRGDSDLCDHAGIYVGYGYAIHCSSGKGKVIISSLLDGFYSERFSWGRRIIKEENSYEHND